MKKNIHYKAGNIIDSTKGKNVVIPHVVNNIDLFGSGFAYAILKEYPAVKSAYHSRQGMDLGEIQVVQNQNGPVFINMCAQDGVVNSKNPHPLLYGALYECMNKVKESTNKGVEIETVKFGCGLAGGDWRQVEYMIETIWKDFQVTVWEL